MSTLLKPIRVRSELVKRNLLLFAPRDFARLFRATATQTKYFLEEYTKAGLFLRLKRGLYALQDTQPSEEEIANQLYRPSYVSFEYALALHRILPEMIYVVTSATTKPTRIFTAAGRTYSYSTIKREAFTGYRPQQREGRTVLIAEPEKALADYLYFVTLGKRPHNDRLDLTALNAQKLQAYAELFERPQLEELVRQLV
jgi:predicted transcriptional regulator of viral defense system